MEPTPKGHLRGLRAPYPPVPSYPPSPKLADVVRHYWIPVWDIPEGQTWPQFTLQAPQALVVIADSYTRFYGVASALSKIELSGTGWAVGTAFLPSAGMNIAGASMATMRDRHIDLREIATLPGDRLTARVREIMSADPHAETSHRAAIAVLEEAYATLPRRDDEGALIDRIVDFVEHNPEVTKVADVLEEFAITERTLQRLTDRRVGLSPKWLIQRRRLREASHRIGASGWSLAEIAYRLGYADQAHFTRDFTAVVGMSPGRYLQRVQHDRAGSAEHQA